MIQIGLNDDIGKEVNQIIVNLMPYRIQPAGYQGVFTLIPKTKQDLPSFGASCGLCELKYADQGAENTP